jgi:CMP-N,N'-diacetyllegionaminic acid synthase
MSNNLCFIPAKGFSRRLPGKNKKLLHGKPLFLYTLEAALNSNCFSSVIVSSDDVEILEIANATGAIGLRRDTRLCKDEIRAKDVVWDYLSNTKKHFEYIGLLMPTTPLRDFADIKSAFEKLKDTNCDSLVSICEYNFNPSMAMKIEKNCVASYFDDELKWEREDLYKTAYHLNGGIYLAKYNFFMKQRTFIGENTIGFVMERDKSIDVDTLSDFKIAECMMSIDK